MKIGKVLCHMLVLEGIRKRVPTHKLLECGTIGAIGVSTRSRVNELDCENIHLQRKSFKMLKHSLRACVLRRVLKLLWFVVRHP